MVHKAGRRAKRVGDSPWLDRAARLGFAARGVLYLTVAVLAASIARGRAGQTADKKGAVTALADTSLGTSLLVVLTAGFVGLGLWQATEALWGKRRERGQTRRSAKRAAAAAKAVVYLVLAGTAASVLLDGGSAQGGGGDQQETTWTGRVLELPAGRVLVAVAGLAILAAGGWLVAFGLRRKFEKHLDTGSMPRSLRKAVGIGGTLGYGARGLVAGLAGLLLVKAALDYNPQEAKGVDGTLRTIVRQPYGRGLLLLAAVGLAAFGLFSFVEARYRRL